MTRLKIFLSRAFPFAARDESINCVIERSRQSRLQLRKALSQMPETPELYEQWRDALKSAFGGDTHESTR